MGSGAQQAAQVLLLAWQIDAALVLLLFSAYLNACCLPRWVETQIQTPVSIAHVDRKSKMEPDFRLEGRSENDKRKK